MIKYILFDFDGTLANSKEVFITCFNQLAVKHGFKQIEKDAIPLLRKMSIKERFRFLKVPYYRMPWLTGQFLALYKQQCKDVALYNNIPDLLLTLKTNYQLAILSTNSKDIITEVLEKNNISLIDKIYCSSKLFGKSYLIKSFLKKYGLKPSEVLYVGDELRDIEACQAAGIAIAWVSWGYDVQETVQANPPDYIVHQPDELIELLTRPQIHSELPAG
jgi:phosphoglycolate phosphatase